MSGHFAAAGVEVGDCSKVFAVKGAHKAPISKGIRDVGFFIHKVDALILNRHVIIYAHFFKE